MLDRVHNVQVDIRFNVEQIQHLVQHTAVLRRCQNTYISPRFRMKAKYYGSHFDTFRAGT